MISLVQLLKEVQGAPKAIILAGAPGSGKSSVVDEIISNLGLKTLNIDDHFIKNLRDAGVSLDLKKAGAEDRSKAAVAMQQAQKSYQEELAREIQNNQNIIIDGTAASYKKTESLKNTLENAGYDVMMVYVYSSLDKSLRKNEDRFERSSGDDRSLMPSIVMQTWANVTQNFIPYLNLFGENFVATTKDKEPFSKKSLEDIIKRYLEPFKPENTKQKTPAEEARKEKEYEKLITDILELRDKESVKNILQQTLPIPQAQSKIKQFLKS